VCLSAYVSFDFDAWNMTTTSSGSIQTALDFEMTILLRSKDESELYLIIRAIATLRVSHLTPRSP
jgi:hypothetical protein